ncbi:hypothetical protein Tco_0648553 [Tanacetum coccineum]
MINYSLWEVIENGNAPPITKVIEGVETIIAPTTTEEKAQRRQFEKRLSKILSVTLEIHGDSISQEDVNRSSKKSVTRNGAHIPLCGGHCLIYFL